MSEAITTARPYAQAIFDEAQRLDDLKGWSAALTILAESLSNEDVKAVVSNPRVAKRKIEELVVELCGTQFSTEQTNLIRVLVEGRRLDVVTEILVMFEALRAEAEKFAEVAVTSAFELSDAQKQKIASALKVRMQCEIKLTCKVDNDLLGGIVIRANDKVIDGSARTRLEEMAVVMA
jgi:F-type H+-transporting ATPase subunit delta